MPHNVRPPRRRRCDCGAPLRWESRQSYSGRQRWLAVCSDGSCGRWSTDLPEGTEPQDPLADFLLSEPPARYLPPWVRLFLRSATLGWASAAFPCRSCDRPLTFVLDLPAERLEPGTPFHVTLCLDCGHTEIKLWALGDVGELHIGAEGWTNPAIAIRALKRTLESRLETQTQE